jgi:hypothetical protein
MRKNSSKNALVHGVYSSDVVLPWESVEDFNELLEDTRLDFQPNGTTEGAIVFEMAVLQWKKRRINRALQLMFLQTSFAAAIKKSGKRSVSGILHFFKTQRIKEGREEGQFAAAVVGLSEATTSLTDYVNGKKKPSEGKLGSNLRSMIGEIESLRPHIEAGAVPQSEEKVVDIASGLDALAHAYGIEERLDALFEKKIKQLILVREFHRQYSQDSSVKLIEQRPSTAKKDVSSKPSVAKPTAGRIARTKKSEGANDNWNDDNNNDDNDNDINPDDYDWAHEYDEALAEKKKKQ